MKWGSTKTYEVRKRYTESGHHLGLASTPVFPTDDSYDSGQEELPGLSAASWFLGDECPLLDRSSSLLRNRTLTDAFQFSG